MTPRDPQRIDRIIELLREVWHLSSDERLTQLIINAADVPYDSRLGSVFYLEDDQMEQRLRGMLNGRKRRANADIPPDRSPSS
jgi:hypothetical protein